MLNRAISLLTGLLVSMAAFAQFEAGSVVGSVKDPVGLAMPNAVVEIRSIGTNVTRKTVTSATGNFDFVALQPGPYELTAKQPGFKEVTQKFELAVGQRLELDLAMEVGATSQSLTVAGNAVTVETVSSEVSNVRTRQQVEDLPLNSRNFTQLVQLAPGVDNHGGATNVTNGGYTEGRGTSGAVINGNPSDIGIYIFDGILGIDADANVLIFYPPVDSIQEFKVQTSAAPAAYGGGPSIINVTFRSGTNALHGTLYEFVRNSDFDAKNYFDSPVNPIPPFHMNEFGANLGGPVVIPHLFNGKDKLFFFADYEGKRVSQAQTYISTVPTAAFRAGDFSGLLPKTVLHVPGTSTPLPNNQVPQINPTSANLMALYPLPNIPGGGLVNNYLYNGALINNIDQGDLRMDYRTEKSAIFGRFSKENAATFNPGFLPGPAIGAGPGYPGDTLAPGTQVVLGYGRSFGPTKYYEARAGFSRLVESIIDADTAHGNLAEQLGIPGANAGGAPGLTTINISGTTGLGDNNGSVAKVNNLIEIDQALSWVKGSHELKFGFNFLSTRFAFFTPPKPNGSFSFTGAYTGYGLADFLYGRPISSQIDVTKFFDLKRYRPSFYIQDNWRVTRKLSVNLGLRDDLVTPWKERHNRLAVFDPSNGGNLVPVGTPGYPADTVTDGRYANLAPRVGFAYSLDAKTVVRGAFGIFYAYETYNSNPQSKNAPFNGSLITTNSTGEAGYAAALPISAGFPAARPDLFSPAGTAFQVFRREYPNPSANEWNFNVQRQFSSHDNLSLAYVGQNGVHILINPNINFPTPGPTPVASRRPYPNLSDGTLNCTCANSSYNSFQVTYLNRLSSTGLDFQGVYTYAHSIDNSSGNSNGTGIQNPANLRLYRANSDFDIRHNLVLSWTYAFPFGRGKKFAGDARGPIEALIGGWRLNSIDTFKRGAPFTPVMVSSLLNSGSAGQWPNRIGSGNLADRSIQAWFNTADFVSPGNYTFGNSGRNILFGPGTRQVDLSLFKDFTFNESRGRRLELRSEAFNVFNTPQFNNPNVQIGSAAAGTITSAGAPLLFQRTSRQVQLALKLHW
ncbi:MAG TPA: carboxypeptidase regulatory-like domain-containing protein [Candidatus Acidoferrales bacterium]|nr:carboxypeptidase regulatory-like domain-containing protein [Candidatus Acidoferrales bacterium]